MRKTKFPPYKPIGEEELTRVKEVFTSGIFSRFLGCWHEDFYGVLTCVVLRRSGPNTLE